MEETEYSFIKTINLIRDKLPAIQEASDLFNADVVDRLEEIAELDITLLVDDLRRGNYLGNRKIDINLSLNMVGIDNDTEESEAEDIWIDETKSVSYDKAIATFVDGETVEVDFIVDGNPVEIATHTDLLIQLNNNAEFLAKTEDTLWRGTPHDVVGEFVRIYDVIGQNSNIERITLNATRGSYKEQMPTYYWAKTTSAFQTLAMRAGDIIKLGNDIDSIILLAKAIEQVLELQNRIPEFVDTYDEQGNPNGDETLYNRLSELTDLHSELSKFIAIYGSLDNINIVGNNTSNIDDVADDLNMGESSNIIRSGENIGSIVSVVANEDNINSVVANESNINSVVANEDNINSVVANESNINSVATNEENINKVVLNETNINSIVSNEVNINSVVANEDNINSVVANEANINSVAINEDNINTVASNNSKVTTVADNIVDIQNAEANADIATAKAQEATLIRDEISNINPSSVQLASDQNAIVTYNSATGSIVFGIPQGLKGERGEAFNIDAQGLLSERSSFNGSAEGFSYFGTDTELLYFKTVDTVGDFWTAGTEFGKGDKGDTGDTGTGILSVARTGTVGLIDTYTITFTDATTTTFTVNNARSITGYSLTSTNLLEDTYTMTYNDGTSNNIVVKNGRSLDSYVFASTTDVSGLAGKSGATDTYRATFNDNTTLDILVYNGLDSAVLSVAGKTGDVTLTETDITDLDKYTQAEVNTKFDNLSLSQITKPAITSPTTGATDFIGEVTATYATSSTFSGIQDYVKWEAGNSDFSVIYDSYDGSSNLTAWTPSIGLALTEVFVRVQMGSDNHLSEVSDIISFTTPNIYVETPTLSVDGAPSDVAETPTLTTSAFSIFNSTDTHASTDWQVIKNSDSSVVYESLADTTNLLSITIPSGVLEVTTAYTFKAKHNSLTYGSSAFVSLSATTKDAFIIPLQTAGTQGYGVTPSSAPFALLGLAEMSGTNTVGHDNYGNYIHTNGSIMCHIPKTYYRIGHVDNPTYAEYGANSIDTKGLETFATEAEANTAGYALHRAFIDGGVEQNGVFIDKYMNSKHADNTQSVSAFGGNPIGLTTNATYNPSSTMTGCSGMLADAVTISRARGAGYNTMAFYHYALLAMLSVAHAQATTSTTVCAWYDATGTTNYPKGCNSSLSDVDDSSVVYTTSGDTADKPLTGATANFAKTTHNGCNNGVADLNGGMYEIPIGLTSAGTSATATTAISNDTIHVLKTSVKLSDLTGGWDGTNDAWGNTTHLNTLFDLVTSPHALGSTTGTVYWGSGANAVFPDDLSGVNRDTCGFIPKNNTATDATGTNQFGTDYMYRYNIMNLSAFCCGYWSHASVAGVFFRYFNRHRSYDGHACSFRSVAYGS